MHSLWFMSSAWWHGKRAELSSVIAGVPCHTDKRIWDWTVPPTNNPLCVLYSQTLHYPEGCEGQKRVFQTSTSSWSSMLGSLVTLKQGGREQMPKTVDWSPGHLLSQNLHEIQSSHMPLVPESRGPVRRCQIFPAWKEALQPKSWSFWDSRLNQIIFPMASQHSRPGAHGCLDLESHSSAGWSQLQEVGTSPGPSPAQGPQ